MSQTIYDFKAKRLDGGEVSLGDYRNNVMLIVNTASHCGFTPQYEGLERLYRRYQKRGFTVLGFPCNQFGEQEPGDAQQIGAFCSKNYQVSFPVFAKIDVNGEQAHPIYKFLKNQAKGALWTEAIKWNFTKFLLDRNGKVVARYGSVTKPEALVKAIEKLLGAV